MSSWEEIADDVVPVLTAPPAGSTSALASGAKRITPTQRGKLGQAMGVSRYLRCPPGPITGPAELVWGGSSTANYRGEYHHISRSALDYDAQAGQLHLRVGSCLEKPPSRLLEGLDLGDILFVDIETIGLSSQHPLFLIGTMTLTERSANIDLLLARTLGEEAAVLTAFAAQARGKMIVTFNGKAFDWPYIEGRAHRLGVPLPAATGHFDLLFAARRKWRSTMPNCRLQTLEMGVCGRGREGDIPSSQIPARYREYLASGTESSYSARLLVPILFHNALDVLTMGELLCHLSTGNST